MSNADLADFEFPTKASKGPRLATGLIAPALAWALVLATLAFGVPKFEALFRDFGVELGGMMRLILGASHYWLVPTIMAGSILLVDLKVREELAMLKDGRSYARAWSAAMLALPLTMLGALVVAIGLTMGSLLLKLS